MLFSNMTVMKEHGLTLNPCRCCNVTLSRVLSGKHTIFAECAVHRKADGRDRCSHLVGGTFNDGGTGHALLCNARDWTPDELCHASA